MDILVNKYRPHSINELIGQEYLKESFRSYLDKGEYGHILLYGPPGTGKTSAVIALAKDYYGRTFGKNFKETNASNDRGIDMVRTAIKQYAKGMAYEGFPYKTMLLDEIEALTKDAQHALRRTMETSDGVRFLATTNHPEKIIAAIKSRFIRLSVPKLDKNTITNHINTICEKEELNISTDIIDYIVDSVDGDMRQALNFIESLPPSPSIALVSTLSPSPTDDNIIDLLNINRTGTDDERWLFMIDVLNSSGWRVNIILDKIWNHYSQKKICPDILDTVGEYMWRVEKGINGKVALYSCLQRLKILEEVY